MEDDSDPEWTSAALAVVESTRVPPVTDEDVEARCDRMHHLYLDRMLLRVALGAHKLISHMYVGWARFHRSSHPT